MAGSAAIGGTVLAAPWVRRARAADDEITIFTWETYHEPPWVKEYEESRGVKVNVVETGSVDEMYAKTRSGALESDLIFIDSGSIPRYVKAGLLAPFDASKVPNRKNVGLADWETMNTVDGALYGGIPYNWGTQPLMYHTDKVVPAPTSWSVLWDAKYKGEILMPDDAYISVPMIALYVGAKDPFNMTDAEFDACRDALKEGPNKCLLHFSDAQGESALSALLTVSVTYRHRKWWHIPVPREPLINQRFPKGTPGAGQDDHQGLRRCNQHLRSG